MKKTVKKISCAALCAIMLFCMAIPAFAKSKYDYHSEIDYGIGVRITCNSALLSKSASGTIILAFVNNVAHFPEEDYSCEATVFVVSAGGVNWDNQANSPGMTATISVPTIDNGTATSSYHEYKANNATVYTKALS